MAVQVSINNNLVPFNRGKDSLTQPDAIIFQDAGRTTDIVFGTLMAKIAATGKWTPFIDETAVNGTAIPQGFYIGADVAFAKIVAGDVLDSLILIGDALLDKNQIVIEASKLLTTIVIVGTTDLRTVEDRLTDRGLFVMDTVDITEFEN